MATAAVTVVAAIPAVATMSIVVTSCQPTTSFTLDEDWYIKTTLNSWYEVRMTFKISFLVSTSVPLPS